jgi:radical SAM protein with 4Fe4S-binding SPASM domain
MYKRVHLEISNICNVQCSFCPIVERPKDIMELGEISKILDQLIPITEDVCLHLMGEPLAHPEFSKILDIGLDKNASFQITTNGLLIKRYQSLILENSVVRQINFSLQAFKDNFPERNISEYLDPIFEFTKEALSTRPELYINFRLWNLKDGNAKDNEEIFCYIEKFFSIEINRNVDPSFKKSKKLMEDSRLYLHFDSRFDWPSLDFPPVAQKGKCHGLRNHFGIHADGKVVPCCLDKEAVIDLGNVFENSIEEILSSPRAKAIKEGFESGVLVEEMCQKCTFRKRFK